MKFVQNFRLVVGSVERAKAQLHTSGNSLLVVTVLVAIACGSCSSTPPPPPVNSSTTPPTISPSAPSTVVPATPIPSSAPAASSIVPNQPDSATVPPAQTATGNITAEPIVITPPTDGCKITSARIDDPNPPVNVRSSPKVDPGNIVGKVDNGQVVGVTEEQNGWFQIVQPKGWINKNLTQTSCSQVNQRITFAPQGNSAIVKGQIIGGGSHKYVISANQGQIMTVTSNQGPLPFVFAPGDVNQQQDLTHIGGNNHANWSGQLPATGDYTILFDSNYKGFQYEISIQVK